ncbi:MAG: hypothetical protein WCK10_01305 [Candidatus Staskawiczbacteria bacterium]
MKKSIESSVPREDQEIIGDASTVQETPVSENVPSSEISDWDHETQKSLASKDFQVEHERKVEAIGTAELAKLREQGEIGIGELTPEKTKELIKSLGDKVFQDIAAAERLSKQQEKDEREEKSRKAKEREQWIKDLDDSRPIRKVQRFFKQMFTPRER